VDVFSKEREETLAPHWPTDRTMDLGPDCNVPYGRIYNLSELQLKSLKAYIESILANGFIQQSSSHTAAPILFANQKDGSRRMCVDYRSLNRATVKNRYPLPLVSEMLDWLRRAGIFTKLDLRNPYHLIRIMEGNEYKTGFGTQYGHCEYQVMPLGLTHAPAAFQAYIDNSLRPVIDDFAVCYVDDILIYSTDQEEYEEHVRNVRERLQEFGLYTNVKSCHLGDKEVSFLGFISSPDGIGME